MKHVILSLMLICGMQIAAAAPAKIIQETIEFAAKVSGKTLSPLTRRSAHKALSKAFAKYGDDVLKMTRHGGLEALKIGSKYGDDFWRLARHAEPSAVRSLVLHSDDLMPLAKRLGADFMRLESKAPGLGAKIVSEFGDDAARTLAKTASADDMSKLLAYSGKADSAATKRMLYDQYQKNGSKFLNALNWKTIMAGGLTASMLMGTYKVTDGIETGLKTVAEKEPNQFVRIVENVFSPLRWVLFAVCFVLLAPPVFHLGKWSYRYWMNRKKEKTEKISEI